ncbi:ribosome small subunit-dependent GTPase A [Actinotalea sp.]|uniref:ribosome small subunit-dependent GTPase A n=1 Tax=Actinotalea sp. TaxID=1872145 RepID=UPI0035686707
MDPSSSHLTTDLSLGRVVRVDRGSCEVVLDGTPSTPLTAPWSAAVTRAAAVDPAATPAAGDWVLLGPGARDGERQLVEIRPRRTELRRLSVAGTSRSQVLAANADVVAVVQAMVPDLDLGRIERLLALAWASGARPVVLLTKADLHPDPDRAVREVRPCAPGCEVLAVAATLGDGLDPVRGWLREGATIALLGASGVGKSTLLNTLVGEDVMPTRSLGAEGKGRHTTVTRELHAVPGGGAVIDTPGLRSVGLQGDEDLDSLFAEISALAAHCRFTDCGHTVEPGCAVLAAVADGTVPARRWESHRALEREASFQARRVDVRLRSEYRKEIRRGARARRREHPHG